MTADVDAGLLHRVVMPYEITQRLQNSPLTGWLWNYWQHGETGRITLLPMWKNPGSRYTKLKLRA